MSGSASIVCALPSTLSAMRFVTGFLPFVPGVARKDRLSISFPLLGSLGFDLKLSVERSAFPGSELAADGVTRLDLGPVHYQSAGVQVGARL